MYFMQYYRFFGQLSFSHSLFFFFFHQSKDKTVFFFAVEEKYEPIGFIHVPGPVQALQWSPPSHVSNTFGFFLPYSVRMSF